MIFQSFKNLLLTFMEFMTVTISEILSSRSIHTLIEPEDMGADDNQILSVIKNALQQPPSMHDITIKLESDLHKYLISSGYEPEDKNKLIKLVFQANDAEITAKASVYPKIIQLHIGCSKKPFPITDEGKQHLLSLLSEIMAQMCQLSGHKATFQKIPLWMITHYHYGQDSSISYNGERFEMTVAKATGEFSRIYDKEINGHQIIRIEEIKTPKCTVEEILHSPSDIPLIMIPSGKCRTLLSNSRVKLSGIVGHGKA